jgi:DNA-binding CsgD family transcriptional regulator
MLRERTGVTLAGRLGRALGQLPPIPPTPAGAAEVVLSSVLDVLGADGGALVLMDPQTALFTTGAVNRLPAPSCHPFFRFEVGSAGERTFRRLAATGRGAVALSLAGMDDGYAHAVLQPYGFTDELRVVCRDAGASWAGLSLWRGPSRDPFTVTEVGALDAVSGAIGAIIRQAVVSSIGVASDLGTRHVVVIDGDEVIESSDRSAVDLPQLSSPEIDVYRHLDHLKELARSDARFSTVIGMADGRWLAAHGAPLGSGRVAIVLTSATPADLFGVVVAGAGLTPREVEVTRLICRGHSDAEIAGLLTISPHTVHDHVRAVRAKLGVRSRAEVAAKVFAERYFDDFLSTAAVNHSS